MRALTKLLSPLRHRSADTDVQGTRAEDETLSKPSSAVERQSIVIGARERTDAGRYSEALALIDRALEAAPRDPELLFGRASALFGWGRFMEAREVLLAAEHFGLRTPDACIKFGWACFWTGKIDEALDSMRRAAAMRPDDWAAQFGVATVLRAQNQVVASRAAFERALELDPGNLHCLSSLVACEIDQRHPDLAERYARRALDLDSRSAAVWSDLGMVLCEQGRYDEAIAAFECAKQWSAATAEAPDEVVNFAICLLRAGRTQQTLTLLEDALPAYPSATGHSQYALALLLSGRYVEGFDQYEFRWLEPPLSSGRPNFVKPVWTGQDLCGKTILLRAEQGFGDFIQFIRYARHIKALGATVLLFVREELRELAEALDEVDRVLRPNHSYPPFDFYVDLLSIPRVFATDLASIPAEVPYLTVDPVRMSTWAKRFEGETKLKVGLVWSGSPTHPRDRFRSLTPQQLAPLMSIGGAQFYSLQKGPTSADLSELTCTRNIIDIGPELNSFADTAAAISQLDLVIGVDTAVVHVAGALAKPVWTLIPNPADWRWLENRDASPWYPTMRLFRQRDHGDWGEVIRRVTAALEVRIREGNDHASASQVAVTSAPVARLKPIPRPVVRLNRGLSCVAETRVGIVQYFPDQPQAGKAIEWCGEHLQSQLDLLAPLITSGMTVMEVGAGVGLHALWLSRAVGPAGHLFLYEDDARQRHVLKQNLTANGAMNVTLMRHSLTTAELPVRVGPTERPALPLHDGAPDRETIDELRLDRLHLLKINGGTDAFDVLGGAGDTIWRLRPRLFVAATDQGLLDDLALHVKAFGYRCWACEAPLFNPDNFNRREENVFSGQSSWALLAIPEETGVEIRENEFVSAHS
jgi:tetratricopeptide (TPR) repeat protein